MKPDQKRPIQNFERLVKADIRLIEPQQFEASFSYKFTQSQNDANLPVRYYLVESYFFFPHQMKVTPQSYPIEHFFRDMKSYINFRIPKLTFKEIIGLTDNPNRSPLKKIKRELIQCQGISDSERAPFMRQEARIFGCSLFNFLERKSKKLERLCQVTNIQESESNDIATEDLFEQSLIKIHTIFREWRRIADPSLSPKQKSLQLEFNIVDEYLIQIIKDFTLSSLETLDRFKIGRKTRSKILRRLRTYLRGLRIYSKQQGYLWIDDLSSTKELESYQYRHGLLKRKVWSALYLDPRVKPLFTLQKQVGAMVAAGAAAIWAFMAEMTIRTSPQFKHGLPGSIEASTFILVTAFALAYVLKDRIKELGRGYFKGGLFGRLPDSNNKIIYPQDSSGQKDLTVGNYQEKARYRSAYRLPESIHEIAERYFPNEEEDARSVICYRQRLSLKPKPIRNLKRKIRAVYTFYRLNIGNLLGPLDSPMENGLVPTRDLHITQRPIPKVYHLNLILKITGKIARHTESTYRYFRIIIDKEGIRRIENLSDRLHVTSSADQDSVPVENKQTHR